jgi:uncharacterized protein
MARLLIWILLAMVVYAVARNWSRRGTDRVKSAAVKPAEAIVTCAACGLNVPQSEAHASDSRWYCSREHLERASQGR